MGLFRRPSPSSAEARSTFSPLSFEQLAAMVVGHSSGTGPISEDRALHSAAAWSCIDVLATTVSSLPIDVIRTVGRTRQPARAPAVIERPSPLVSRRVWLYSLMFSLCTDGNAFGWIGENLDELGNPTRIDLMHPSGVTGRRVGADGVAEVTINGKGTHKLWPYGPVWHVPGKMVAAGSPFALSPLSYAGTSITAGIAAEGYGARFFTDGGHPSAILHADQELDEGAARRIKAAFVAAIRPGSREPAVMGSGLTYTPVQSDPSSTQFIELIRFSIEQACRYWRVPPAMVYSAVSGQSVTYANVSQADLHYLKHSVDGYLTSLEESLSALLTAPRSVKVNRDAMLRADPLERYKLHELALKNRVRTVNEVRVLEDEAPFSDEFDMPGVPPIPGAPGSPIPFQPPVTSTQEGDT
jgi:HK97 family phage portal protein